MIRVRTFPRRRTVPWRDALTFPLWFALDAAAWLLRVTVNRSWRGPSVLVGANDDAVARRGMEEAGAFAAVWMEGDE